MKQRSLTQETAVHVLVKPKTTVGAQFGSVGGAPVPCAEALRQTWVRLTTWVPLLSVAPPLSLFPVMSSAVLSIKPSKGPKNILK